MQHFFINCIQGKFNEKNSKVFIYALAIALVLGVCLIVVQDIKVPSEHVSQSIEVVLDK